MSDRRTLRLTLAQLRMVNTALAMYEADDHDDTLSPRYSQAVMDRTRTAVFAALGTDAP